MYKFQSPHGTVDDYPPKSEKRGMLRVKFMQSTWNSDGNIAGHHVSSVFGDQFFADEPWVYFNPKGLMKWAWIEDMLGVPFDKFRKWIAGFDEILAEKWRYEFSIDNPVAEHGGDRKSDAMKAKIAEARAIPLSKHGESKMQDQATIGSLISHGGNTDYTLRRLARDNPEMIDRIKSGELSVNKAAIAAGIRKKPTHAEICVKAFAKTETRLDVLQSIAETLKTHEMEYLMTVIKTRLDSIEQHVILSTSVNKSEHCQ